MVVPNLVYVSAASLGKVKNLKAETVATTSVSLSWSKVSGATGYQVYQYNSSSKKWEKIKNVTKTSYTVTSLSSAKTYKFKVRAYKGSSLYGAYSSAISVSTKPAKVKNLKAGTVTTTAVPLSWDKVTRATGYQVYQYNASSKKWEKVKSTTKTSYTVTSLSSAKTYKFKVRAYFKGDTTAYGSYSSEISVTTKPAKVTGLKVTDKTDLNFTLKWNKVSGASGYEVYKLTGKTWQLLRFTTATSVTIEDAGTLNDYKVRAYVIVSNAAVCGAFSSPIAASANKSNGNDIEPSDTTGKAPAVPKGLTLKSEPKNNRIVISWNKVSSATGYKVYLYDSLNGKWTLIKKTSSTSFNYTVKETAVYYFAVRSYKTSGSVTYNSALCSAEGVQYIAKTASGNSTINSLEKSGILGYLYDPKGNFFYTSSDPWQRSLGFTPIYDAAAPFVIMFYNTVRFKFNYDNLDWMIQIWKGQYGWVFVGAEIGVYIKNPNVNVAGFYACADDENSLKMSMVLYRNNKVIVNRSYGTYWWCTGFVPGVLPEAIAGGALGLGTPNTKELKMIARITMKSTAMLRAFEGALKKEGFKENKDYIASGLDVIFIWQ